MTSINFLFNWLRNNLLRNSIDRWDNVFKNGTSKICGRNVRALRFKISGKYEGNFAVLV